MKVLTVLYAMLFATFAVAGPAQANGQDENTVEKRRTANGNVCMAAVMAHTFVEDCWDAYLSVAWLIYRFWSGVNWNGTLYNGIFYKSKRIPKGPFFEQPWALRPSLITSGLQHTHRRAHALIPADPKRKAALP
ncbi:hypothetical protein M752DRAFT_265802 [Aspergillus phoenicis ATCC 13157]|uniref:Uncharacterized protein n=1 Tax=Aspergillus phoenicis ATCC 13157 TaxID=1353007 RepID=A0A370PL55_ASPPH|nr:hypothetical protein M752DRAFT_265802 [Aspergillus phoenicis ATCC 13157]